MAEAAQAEARASAGREAAARAAADRAALAEMAAAESVRALEFDRDSLKEELEEAREQLRGARQTINAYESRVAFAERQAAEAAEDAHLQRVREQSGRLRGLLRRGSVLLLGQAWGQWRRVVAGGEAEEAVLTTMRRITAAAPGTPRPVPPRLSPTTPRPLATSPFSGPRGAAAKASTPCACDAAAAAPVDGSGEVAAEAATEAARAAAMEAEMEAYELRLVVAILGRAVRASEAHRDSVALAHAVYTWQRAVSEPSARSQRSPYAPASCSTRWQPTGSWSISPTRVHPVEMHRAAAALPAPAHPTPAHPTPAPSASTDAALERAALERELDVSEGRLAAAALSRALRAAEATDQAAALRCLRRWHAVLVYARAFTTAYALGGHRAKAALERQAAAGESSTLLSRSTAVAMAVHTTCAFLRMGGGYPAIFEQKQRVIGRWLAAVGGFESREMKREIAMGTRN